MEPDNEPLAITPTAFTPLAEQRESARWRPSTLQWLLGVALLGFALALWFLFTARSVLFELEPGSADIDIDGGFQFKLGERFLLRSGDYTIAITAPGYYPVTESITIGPQDSQSFHHTLTRLPGILSFSSNPAGAQISIDGEFVGTTPLQGLAVDAGEHNLRVWAERYLPHEQLIAVNGMEQPQAFSLELPPAWANVAVTSDPPGAEVFVDGEPSGTTPALVEVLEGEHVLDLRLQRYRAWRQKLDITAGVHQDLGNVVLEAANAQLLLNSRPSRASVTLDGEYRGQTPIELALEPGTSHRVAVFKAGYRSVNRNVNLQAAEQRQETVTLPAQLGDVQVQVFPANAEIRVNGQVKGQGSRTLSLPAFEQTLEVSAPGFSSQRQRFTPREGINQVVAIRLLTESEAKLANLKPEIAVAGGQVLKLFTPGEFVMGASRREPGRQANEVLHPVSLTRLFYLGTKEVSNGDFRRFRKEHNSGRVEGNSLNRDQQPAVKISWVDAALYCNWLSEQADLPVFYQVEGDAVVGFNVRSHGFRMPTEAEWAWAARVHGEKLLNFPWGASFPPTTTDGNYAGSSSAFITGRTIKGYKDGHIVTAPVGSFSPNGRGLYDMGGNVAEWVHDVYAIPDAGGTAQVDPLGAQKANNHVIRGSSWIHSGVTELRLVFRDYGKAPRDDVGFRIARYAEEKQ